MKKTKTNPFVIIYNKIKNKILSYVYFVVDKISRRFPKFGNGIKQFVNNAHECNVKVSSIFFTFVSLIISIVFLAMYEYQLSLNYNPFLNGLSQYYLILLLIKFAILTSSIVLIVKNKLSLYSQSLIYISTGYALLILSSILSVLINNIDNYNLTPNKFMMVFSNIFFAYKFISLFIKIKNSRKNSLLDQTYNRLKITEVAVSILFLFLSVSSYYFHDAKKFLKYVPNLIPIIYYGIIIMSFVMIASGIKKKKFFKKIDKYNKNQKIIYFNKEKDYFKI